MGRSSSPQAPGLYPNGIDPNDFGTQNRMADAGVYQAGTVGADNALANGTGMVLGPDGSLRGQPPAAAAPAAPGPTHADPATTVRTVTGSPADAQALSGLYPSTGGRGASAPGLYPPVAGLNAATSVDNLRAAFDSDRVFRTQIEPYIPTPGMAPEAAASRFGYLDKLALRSAGVPEAAPGPLSTVSGDGWLRGRNAAEPITLPGGEKALAPGQKLPPETDINRSRVSQLAAQGRSLALQQMEPQVRTFDRDDRGQPLPTPVRALYSSKTGKLDELPGAPKPAQRSELGRLIDERAVYLKAGDTANVAHYDRVIASLHNSAGREKPVAPVPAAAGGEEAAGEQAAPAPAPAAAVPLHQINVLNELTKRKLR